MTDNTIDFDAVDGEFSQNISPKGLTHADVGVKTDFFGWHKPRKHWLRINQWNASISKLISTLKLSSQSRPLSYLSLPGPDLLDVRAIQPICAKVDVKLRFLGLNNIEEHEEKLATEQALSISEVRAMSHIDAGSSVVIDKFQHIANTNSVAYSRVIKDKASFDIVNIDLCRSFAETKPEEKNHDYYNALFKLLRHQAETRVDDWLFFLTTRNNQDMVHQETMNKFIVSINEMLVADPAFQKTLIDKNIILSAAFSDNAINQEKLDPTSFANAFLLGVGNWINHALFDSNPKWKVQILPVFGYHIAEQGPDCDMISIGFYCSRVLEPAVDTQGLAGISVNENVKELADIAKDCLVRLINKIEKQTDIDVKLYREPDIYRASLEGSVNLLRAARYSESEYRKWEEKGNLNLTQFLTKHGLIENGVTT